MASVEYPPSILFMGCAPGTTAYEGVTDAVSCSLPSVIPTPYSPGALSDPIVALVRSSSLGIQRVR